jgi:hypothetical protein
MGAGMGGWGTPGASANRVTTERNIYAGGDKHARIIQSTVVSGAARDAGNTPTTVLRPGLIFGKLDSGGKFEEWDAQASDGTQNIAGILDEVELRAQDYDATNQDRHFGMLKGNAWLKASQLLIQGAAFVGHVDEFLARRQLFAAGIRLDDDPFGYLAGYGDRVSYETATTDTLTASQNGMTLFYNNAASVTVTLPAIQPGLSYELVRVGDEEFIFVSPTADNVIVGNDLSADGVTVTTASEQLGARWRIRSVYVSTTLKWLVEGPLCPFGTGTATITYAINT